MNRRFFLAGLTATPLAQAADLPAVKLGIVPSGTVQWIADVITTHGFDRAAGFTLVTQKLASTEAAKVALLGRAVQISLSDWPFVAAQRAHGGGLTFSPASSASGSIMVPAFSPVRRLTDLRGMRLGVAGGGGDKSWLIVKAAAAKAGLDLAREATLSFGAPPLLSAEMEAERLDALLTFWNFSARLEAAGMREAVSVAHCARLLGLATAPTLLGYVFEDGWAAKNPVLISGFLRAARRAAAVLESSEAEWRRIRPLMDAPDDLLFDALRRRFVAGISHPAPAAMQAEAVQLLAAIGDGSTVPAGTFWASS